MSYTKEKIHMKNLVSKISILLISIIILGACSQDEPTLIEEEIITTTQTDIIIGKWKIIKLEDIEAGVTTDVTDEEDLCFRDNILEFKVDMTYQITEGATKCDTSDPNIYEEGTFRLTNDDNTLELTTKGKAYEVAIEKLN